MSALTNLKLFLERNKTDFYTGNADLLDWLQDRDLKVENLGQIGVIKEKNSQTIVNSVEAKVIKEFGHTLKNKKQLESKISLEEYEAIFEKLVNLVNLPAGQLENQSELYLEQQLSDMLDFDITAQLDEHRLNYSTGIMGTQPHLRRYPTDELKNHSSIPEAGLSKTRSAFGWFINHGSITPEAEEFEKYYFSLNLYNLENWSSQYKELKKWYKFRKMIVINPAEKTAVVGVVGNISSESQLKKQFGASPEIIREGLIWSPKAQGKVLLMFVDDPKNKVPLGPIYFDKLLKI